MLALKSPTNNRKDQRAQMNTAFLVLFLFRETHSRNHLCPQKKTQKKKNTPGPESIPQMKRPSRALINHIQIHGNIAFSPIGHNQYPKYPSPDVCLKSSTEKQTASSGLYIFPLLCSI